MISKAEIKRAIAECQGEANPNSTTCIKLAAYYTILNNLEVPQMSFASKPIEEVRYSGDSEFFDAIRGADMKDVLVVIDELMDGVKALIPQLYGVTIERLKNL